jgi:hypothetical protein
MKAMSFSFLADEATSSLVGGLPASSWRGGQMYTLEALSWWSGWMERAVSSCKVAGEGRAAGQEGTSAAALSTGRPLPLLAGVIWEKSRERLVAE